MNFPTNHLNIYSHAGFSLLEGNISRCWLIATYSSRSRSKYMYIWCGLALLCTSVETACSLCIPVACEMLCTPLTNEWLGDTKCFQPTDWLIWCYNCEVICQLLSQILVNLKTLAKAEKWRTEPNRSVDLKYLSFFEFTWAGQLLYTFLEHIMQFLVSCYCVKQHNSVWPWLFMDCSPILIKVGNYDKKSCEFWSVNSMPGCILQLLQLWQILWQPVCQRGAHEIHSLVM